MELQYIVDAVLLLIFALVIIHSARVGLSRALAGIVAWIVAGLVAVNCCAPASEWVYAYIFQDRVIASIEENLDETGVDEVIVATNSAIEEVPDFIVQMAGSIGIDVNELKAKTEKVDVVEHNAAETIERTVFAPMFKAALKAILFLLMLIVISAALRLVLHPICTVLSKTPGVGSADRALGAVLGILKGAILVSVLAMLARIAAGFVDGPYADAVAQSKLISFVTEGPFANGFFE